MRLTTLCIAAVIAGSAQAAEMKVFKQPNFSGESLTLNGETRDLTRRGFQDQISSVIVGSGRWEVCTQPNFGGDCVTLGRGSYAALDPKLNHRIESARVIEDRIAQPEPRHRPERPSYARDSSIELYTRPGFEGRTVRIEQDEASLAHTGVDRRVWSAIVNEGSWQVCSQPGFRGYCRVLEPGQYEDLGRMSGQIGSVRRLG